MLLNLIEEQIKLCLDPTICSIGDPSIKEKPLEVEALKRGFKVRKFRMRPGPNLLGALAILQFARKEHFDLMHSHGYKSNILFGFIPKLLRKIPIISTLHGWTNTDSFSKMRIYEWFDVKSLKHIDAVVIVSKCMLNNSRLKSHNRLNLYVVENGIPGLDCASTGNVISNKSFLYDTLDKEIIDFCHEGFIVGAIGRLSQEKNFEYLIRALYQLAKKCNDIKLVIIGEGRERDSLEQLINKYKLKGKVLLPGYRKNANRYLKFINIFVVSSLTEGLPITVLEAMQSGVPIISTSVGGIPNVLDNGKAGILIPPSDIGRLVEAIYKLYQNKNLREELAERAKQIVMNKYTSVRMTSQYFDIYKEVLARRHVACKP